MVVIAAHGERAFVDEIHHRLDRPFRISAIADVVAEADDAVRAMRLGKIEAGAEGLPIGVNVRKKCQQHAFLREPTLSSGLFAGVDGYQKEARKARKTPERCQRLRGVSRPLIKSARSASIRAARCGSLQSSGCAG